MGPAKLNPREHGDLAVDEELNRKLAALFTKPVLKKLEQLRYERRLSETARELDFHPNRLTELLNRKRQLTAYYLAKFIAGGIMQVSEILQGRRLEDLPEDVQLFFHRQMVDDEIVKLIVGLQEQGRNVKQMLRPPLGINNEVFNLVLRAMERGVNIKQLLESVLPPK